MVIEVEPHALDRPALPFADPEDVADVEALGIPTQDQAVEGKALALRHFGEIADMGSTVTRAQPVLS